MTRRVEPDDAVYQIHNVWLGPDGFYVGAVRYLTLAVGLATFVLIWLVESAFGSMPIPPVKEISASILVAGGLMQFVSPETPLWSVLRTAWAEVTAPRPARSRAVLVPVRPRVVAR